jgi:glutamyl/glutaminyl-tRNA synthetase
MGGAPDTTALRSGALLERRLPASGWRTRFAPAPTGYLHLGHLVNAIHVWGLARAYGGSVLLRLEDHDLTRCKPEYEQALLDDLEWLGFIPDEAPVAEFRAGRTPCRQSDNTAAYERALAALEADGRVYPCTCSRREVLQVAGAVVPGDEPCYPGTCRATPRGADSTRARRVRIDHVPVTFDDLRLGRQEQLPATQCGDVLVRDRFGHWTYQFAVVVDDRDQRVDVVIRGEDLLPSTGRQLLLARLLRRSVPPQYLHHPLLRHADGRKLSKAAADTSLRELRRGGATAAGLIGEAAARCGLVPAARTITAAEVAALFV